MTTKAAEMPRPRTISDSLQESLHFLIRLETDSSLFEPHQLQKRLDLLDELDARFGDLCSETFAEDTFYATIDLRARAIRTQFEALNTELYRSLRFDIQCGAQPQELLSWARNSACHQNGRPASGPAYDYQDELVSGILQLQEPAEVNSQPGYEMLFYQPTPVRHILHLITSSALSEADTLVDLGSGLGHVPLLASMFTGARSFGIEIEAAYVASARECAESLSLSRVQFIQQDARAADLSNGTVFYLYSPFTGSILAHVLEKLQKESTYRPIKICTFGPCTSIVAKEPWLTATAPPDPEQITTFQTIA
jgi:hypothetical protein